MQTLESRYGVAEGIAPAELMQTLFPSQSPPLEKLTRLGKLDETEQAFAYVNHGRWVVGCPFCTSAQLAARTDRRFLCAQCMNVQVGGAAVVVVWPSDSAVAKAERALSKRPIENQNWDPRAQTLASLEKESAP